LFFTIHSRLKGMKSLKDDTSDFYALQCLEGER
jgi:hypothetical protein